MDFLLSSKQADAATGKRHDHILTLTEDLIGRILFSGYLGKNWYTMISIILVNKTFLNLARTYIAFVDQKNRVEYCPKTMKLQPLSILGIGNVCHNLVYLDLGYCSTIKVEDLTPLGKMLTKFCHSLRGLNMRSCGGINDNFLRMYVSKLTQLRFLDVSRVAVSERNSISDAGATHLKNLVNLKWLNLSTTGISNSTVSKLQEHCPRLEHLEFHSCVKLTDASLSSLKLLRLHTLDISNCKLITADGIEELCQDVMAPVHTTLEIFACSFLPAVPGNRGLSSILNLTNLRKLEFRKRLSDVITEPVMNKAREQLKTLIISHKDQLTEIKELSIVAQTPELETLCPVLKWPYSKVAL